MSRLGTARPEITCGTDPMFTAYVLAKLPDHPAKWINELHPWNWKARQQAIAQAA